MKHSKKYWIWTIIVSVFALAINVYIIMHSCLNASQSTDASKGIVEVVENVVNTIAPGTVTSSNYDSFVTFVRKAFGHFGLFMISGLLTSISTYLLLNPIRGSKYWMLISISLEFGLLMGLVTETIQLNVPGRSGELLDVLIDFSGYLLGFLIIFLILFLIIRKQNKKSTVTN